MKKKIAVLGKGDLAIKCCEFIKKHHNLKVVVPDTPEPEWSNSLSGWAKSENIEVIDSGDYKELNLDEIDLAVSVFYGKIFKKDILDKCSVINLHNAPLPKYRGVRPINWALKNNENFHGVTIHKVSEGIDDGDILGRITYPIYPEIEEVEDVYKKALDYGYILFKDVMSKIDFCLTHATPQKDFKEKPTYFSMKDSKFLLERSDFRR